MNTSNPTEDQHFVPRFYLKNFADKDGYLEVFNVKENRMAKRRPYQGLGYAKYFYAAKTGVPDDVSQYIEKWFNPMEDFIAKELPRITCQILENKHIEHDDRYILAVLMSMLWLRTHGMRNQLKQMEDDMAVQIKRIHGSESAERFKSKDNMTHLRYMVNSLGFGGLGFANMFCAMKWKAYIARVARGKEVFVTSDSPVVELWLPPRGIYGASFLERDKYFALTPQIFLKLTHPQGATKLKRETLYEDKDDVVRALNIITTTHAQELAFSSNRTCLEQLLAGRANPGRLEIEYVKKYEIPWKEYRAKMGR